MDKIKSILPYFLGMLSTDMYRSFAMDDRYFNANPHSRVRMSKRYRHPGLTFDQVDKKYPDATRIAPRVFRPKPGEKRLTWLVVNDGKHIQLPRAYC